jgi:hypothetical protein
MGANGRRIVLERYNWKTIGAQMAEVYAWVSGGPRPTSVPVNGLCHG